MDVVIPTRNRREDLERCLDSLARQTQPPDRVIVVDASTDTAAEPYRGPFEIRVERSLPPSATRQRNVGIDLTRAELVTFLDDDVELEPEYLARVAGWFASHAECVGLSGNIVNERPRSAPSRLYRRAFCLSNDDGQLLRSGDVAYIRRPTVPARVDSLSGGNMTFRRAIVGSLRFDEEMPFYAEDVDFSLRASRYGELWMIPNARLVHNKSPHARAPKRHYYRQAIATSAYLFAKHREEFGLHRTAFARRLTGRAIAYALMCIPDRSLEPLRGTLSGLADIRAMMSRGAANGRT